MRAVLAAAAIATAGVSSGCGASHALDPVARAADVTSKVQGYRLQATTSVGTAAGSVQVTMSGMMNRADRTGEMTAHENIAGHALTLSERFSGLTFYMDAAGLPGVAQVTHGKRWLKMDMSRTLGSLGLGSLSTTSSDPSQFVDYLRAVSADTTRLGTARVRGTPTTHYHAIVDLSRYPQLVPASGRAAARRGISTLETVLGSHTMAMDVWVGSDKLVRRLRFGYPECVNNQRLSFNMTMDLYDYGPQPRTQVPPDSQSYDLTPMVAAAMKNIKFGCNGSSA